MRIIFDLMGTVFGAVDMSLRPGIKETIEALRENGFHVAFWTGGPLDQYRDHLKTNGIIGEVYRKEGPLPYSPDICVDDNPEDWMPGRVFTVKTHISDAMPGGFILVAELMNTSDRDFFWD